jgi:predicted secreted hydrolase
MRSGDATCQLLQGSAARWRSGLPPALADFYASNTPAFAVRACLADFELELFLRPRKDPVTYGEGGSPSLPSQSRTVIHYVQRPRLDLVGTLRRRAHGEWGPVRVLRGAATQDRHWMTVRELDLKWTWMMARLDDGRECMAYELRRGSGGRTKPPSQGDRVGGGAWLVERDGAVRGSARWDLAVGPEDDAPTSRGPVPGRVELTMPELGVNLVVAPRQLTFVPTRALGELVDAGIWESPGRLVRGPCSGGDFWIDYMPPWGGA